VTDPSATEGDAVGRRSASVPVEERYEDAPVALLTTWPDGTVATVNRTFERWTGLVRDELVGVRRVHDLLAPGDRIFYETHLAPLLHMQGEVRAVAIEIVGAGGRRLPALVTSSLGRDERGEVTHVHMAIVDAADRRAYEQELLREMRRAEASEERARVLARTLQESLIPPTPPRIPSFDVGAVYRPAGAGDEVGGDFYDVFETPTGAWEIVLGDVTGKGAEAAVVTALSRYTIRAAVAQSAGPAAVLRMLNSALLRDDVQRPVTVVCASVVPRTGRVVVATGGHPLPLRLTAAGVEAFGRPGMMLGVFDDAPSHEARTSLAPGEALVFYTDGITEGRRGADEWFGDDRLIASLGALRGRTASDIASALVDEAVDFQGGDPRDDIAVVVLAASPTTSQPPAEAFSTGQT